NVDVPGWFSTGRARSGSGAGGLLHAMPALLPAAIARSASSRVSRARVTRGCPSSLSSTRGSPEGRRAITRPSYPTPRQRGLAIAHGGHRDVARPLCVGGGRDRPEGEDAESRWRTPHGRTLRRWRRGG